ncbi:MULTISPECIES: acyltransferase [Lactobacillaceae]|uniref:acyltransferase n=1 Tax=Lactobacillaceae TaxID=33958 RepID=UPI001F18D7AA|nr:MULTISPECIES: acyltransferase [Lactobacillaceae]MCE6013863.1 acyltransferase [Levilactobacillus brevis]MCE6016204.1 acyltransferase [Levilactobacillus brevis]MCE6018619.1 acyltransferase [Levilactobacillus brevis]MCE6023543.1 acyltransferase [Levilactobacillus brevis]
MIITKIIFHLRAIVGRVWYELIFRERLHLGKNVTWRKSFMLMLGKNAKVMIGDGCFFNNFCSINALENVSIGRYCMFGEGVKIYDHNHRFNVSGKLIKEMGYSKARLTIGDNCWIGSNVILLKGANIGNNCVIASGCVISSNIPDGTLVRNASPIELENIKLKEETK